MSWRVGVSQSPLVFSGPEDAPKAGATSRLSGLTMRDCRLVWDASKGRKIVLDEKRRCRLLLCFHKSEGVDGTDESASRKRSGV